MKILVIDDNPLHQEAARKQLASEHDLTVVGSYDEGQSLLGYEKRDCHSDKHDFDIVLVDLLMPPSRQMQASFKAWGEMPVGIFLALLAAKNGAKHVAVLTDSDHHSHPASACFDAFNKRVYDPTAFTVGSAKVVLCNNSGLVRNDESAQPVEVEHTRDDGTKWVEKQYPRIKRWDWLLRNLLAPPTTSDEGGVA